MLRYLAVLAVMLACFTGDVSAVTDQEFQDLSSLVLGMKTEIKDLLSMKAEFKELSSVVKTQASKIIDLEEQLEASLDPSRTAKESVIPSRAFSIENFIQNSTIEERVTTLEVQMMDVQEDITEINEDVSLLFEDVNFLFDEQVIQDERLFSLEQNTDQIEDNVEDLQDITQELDFRVTVLEENGGGDGNSSISELEQRVETLEGTTADHETRITNTEENVEGLEGSSADHETRLTTAEENIQGLQMTDINHESRISALEENGGGGGGSQNETIAFHTVLTDYDTIPEETFVQFNEIVLNEGNGYDSTTGVFTVPPGGDGVYYFSTYLLVDDGEYGNFAMVLNDEMVCSAREEHDSSGQLDTAQAMCSAVVSVEEGDEVKVVLIFSSNDTPLWVNTEFSYNGFNGFRI